MTPQPFLDAALEVLKPSPEGPEALVLADDLSPLDRVINGAGTSAELTDGLRQLANFANFVREQRRSPTAAAKLLKAVATRSLKALQRHTQAALGVSRDSFK